jgi:ketosteroid isomerase-like protein
MAFLAAMVAAPALASDKDDVQKLVDQYSAAFNARDLKAWTGLCTSDAQIVDDFAPFKFAGPNACGKWWSGFIAEGKQGSITDGKIAPGKVATMNIDGGKAYAVYPTDFTFKEKGKPGVQHGVWSFTAEKVKGHWKISGWTWSAL